MNLREKVIEGFVHTYIENEEKIIRNLLQTGRLEREEWSSIAAQLSDLENSYSEGSLGPEEYIKKRKEVRKEIEKAREEKKAGITREEAEDLYREIKESQRDVLQKAYIESDFSIIRIMVKILSARMKFIAARLKNI